MPSDPNAGLIKALEGVARALAEHNRQLIDSTKAVKELTKEVKARVPRRMTITNTPYLEPSAPDSNSQE